MVQVNFPTGNEIAGCFGSESTDEMKMESAAVRMQYAMQAQDRYELRKSIERSRKRDFVLWCVSAYALVMTAISLFLSWQMVA